MAHPRSATVLTRFLRGTGAIGLVLVASLAEAGCGDASQAPGDRGAALETGSATIVVSALSAPNVASATVTVTAADLPAGLVVSLAVSGGAGQAMLDRIPVGAGRMFTFSAKDATGAEIYRGESGPFAIVSGQVLKVVILAQATSPNVPWTDAAPVIDLARASVGRVAPGGLVGLAVTAHDPDQGDTLSYAWFASIGTFSAPDTSGTTWTAPFTEGTIPIYVTVTDSHAVTATSSMNIIVAANPTDAGNGLSAPIPRSTTGVLAALLALLGLVAKAPRKR